MVLPHQLIAHLHRYQHLVFEEDECSKYWEHSRRWFEWGETHYELRQSIGSGTPHCPLFLYADDTKFSEEEKLTIICLGGTLDTRSSSMETHWPLFVVRVVPWLILIC